jgi:hypothetical protein
MAHARLVAASKAFRDDAVVAQALGGVCQELQQPLQAQHALQRAHELTSRPMLFSWVSLRLDSLLSSPATSALL